MRKMRWMAMIALVLLAAALRPCPASAYTYGGAWQPNDLNNTQDDVFTFALHLVAQDVSYPRMAFYDWGNPGSALWVITPTARTRTVNFSNIGGTWYMGFTPNSTTVSLGPTAEFGIKFGMVSGGGVVTNLQYDVVPIPGVEAYEVWDIVGQPSSGTGVLIHDASPVPVPASVLLLGSGLFGLIAVRGRRN
ncbi:MAG: hypothetical protein AB1634_01540 [Thermodesulfobacteriota bacterium]